MFEYKHPAAIVVGVWPLTSVCAGYECCIAGALIEAVHN